MFFDISKIKPYQTNNFKLCSAYLTNMESQTELVTFSDPAQLLLSPAGKTKIAGYMLSPLALSQISRILCPGLVKLLSELLGISQYERPARPDLAIEIYNKLLLANTDLLQDKLLVIDLKNKQIDGIISAGYQRLTNSDFLTLVNEILYDTQSCRFTSANLNGRTLILSYSFDKLLTKKPEVYRYGYYFSNSEVADASVKSGSMLVREVTNDRAVSIFKRYGRIIHSGKDFYKRVQRALYFNLNKELNMDYVRSSLIKISKMSLGFAGLKEDKVVTQKLDDLIFRLSRYGKLSSQLAERIVHSALMQGHDLTMPKSSDIYVRKSLWGVRTLYDLFVALMRDAVTRSFAVRELLERTAYSVLTFNRNYT